MKVTIQLLSTFAIGLLCGFGVAGHSSGKSPPPPPETSAHSHTERLDVLPFLADEHYKKDFANVLARVDLPRETTLTALNNAGNAAISNVFSLFDNARTNYDRDWSGVVDSAVRADIAAGVTDEEIRSRIIELEAASRRMVDDFSQMEHARRVELAAEAENQAQLNAAYFNR